MNLNHKQQEIVESYVADLRTRFPEIEFLDVVPSVDGPNTIWILVTDPNSEERLIDLFEFSGQRAVDILDDYGYHILVQPVGNNKNGVARRFENKERDILQA